MSMKLAPDRFFAALADETRLRALMLLWSEGELCVCDLTQALGVSQPKVSRHLATLRKAGVVEDRRDGTWVYYALKEELPEWAAAVLDELADALTGEKPYRGD